MERKESKERREEGRMFVKERRKEEIKERRKEQLERKKVRKDGW